MTLVERLREAANIWTVGMSEHKLLLDSIAEIESLQRECELWKELDALNEGSYRYEMIRDQVQSIRDQREGKRE